MSYDYYRNESQMRFGGGVTPMVKRLIIANVAVFVLQTMLGRAASRQFIELFGLVPLSVFRAGMFW